MRYTRWSFFVAGILAVAGFAPCQQAAPSPDGLNPLIMRVNGEPVYAAEISLVMRTMVGQLEQNGSDFEIEQVLQAATDRAIEQKLLAQEARRFGLSPDEERVAQQMAAADQRAGGREALAATLAAGGSSPEQLENLFREIELGRAFINNQIRPTVQVSDDDVVEFYNSNPDIFVVDEQVRARHILFTVDERADAGADRQARRRAEQARARALAGEDFAELARELSEGPTAPNGGDLGYFSRTTMAPPVAEAAFALDSGEISDVVTSSFGYHVIRVEDHRPPGLIPFEEARVQARTILTNQKTAETVGTLLKTLYDNADIELLDQSVPAPPGQPPAE
jgi:peptidyl-prolyl cis-trans isomerase C